MPALATQIPLIRTALNPPAPVAAPAARLNAALVLARVVDQPPLHAEVAEFLDLLLSPPVVLGPAPALGAPPVAPPPPAWTPTLQQQNALNSIVGLPGGLSVMGVPLYNVGGFLNTAGPLIFVNFDRILVALQLIIRVADPNRIEQATHSVCGPLVLMESFARNYPQQYADYVIGLCTNRTGIIQTAGGAKTIHLHGNSNLLTANPPHAEIRQADYVALGSLRDQGQWLIHTPYESVFTNQMLEGATMAMTLCRWLEDAGYHNVADHTVSRAKNLVAKMMPHLGGARASYGDWVMRNNVQQAINELAAGKTVFVCCASNLAHFALGRIHRDSTTWQAFGGHWITLLTAVIGANGVDFTIRTWGQETAAVVPMPWTKVGNWYRGFVCATP